jgi:hypothetical protein
MPVTVTLYNHTAKRFLSGENAQSDTYKINLYTTLPFDPAATTKAGAESGATQTPTNFGYVQNTKTLANVLVSVTTTNDAKFDADDVTWSASGGAITAGYALVYNDTDANGPPVMHIDFGGSQSAQDTTDFKIVWNASGIITSTVA